MSECDRTAETTLRPHGSVPRFIAEQYGGARQFRVAHRASLRNALAALNEARLGCAYSGDMRVLQEAVKLIEHAIEHCRPHNWEGRNR